MYLKFLSNASNSRQDDDIDHINDLWQEVYSSNLTSGVYYLFILYPNPPIATEQLPMEVHRNCGLLSQVANSQQSELAAIEINDHTN